MITRRRPGKPGSNGFARCVSVFLFFIPLMGAGASPPYFQQEVNVSIRVTLDDIHHMLTGTEELEYINHSNYKILLENGQIS